jgi:hypothetical protein
VPFLVADLGTDTSSLLVRISKPCALPFTLTTRSPAATAALMALATSL